MSWIYPFFSSSVNFPCSVWVYSDNKKHSKRPYSFPDIPCASYGMHFVWTLNSFQSPVFIIVSPSSCNFLCKFLLCSGNNWEGVQLKLKPATSHIKYVNSAMQLAFLKAVLSNSLKQSKGSLGLISPSDLQPFTLHGNLILINGKN